MRALMSLIALAAAAAAGAGVRMSAVGAGVPGATVFADDFESYDPGQDGAAFLEDFGVWGGEYRPNARVVSIDPIQGISARHVMDGMNSLGRGIAGYEIESPIFPAETGLFEADLRLSRAEGNAPGEYHVALYDTETLHFAARVRLRWRNATEGVIEVGNVTSGFIASGYEFVDTGTGFGPGETFRLGIDVAPGGALRVFRSGEMVYEGVETNRAILGRTGRIGRIMMWTNNDGLGAADGTGSTLTMDNVSFALTACPEDVDGDGAIGAGDLSAVLAAWTECGDPRLACAADITGDGVVNASDLGRMLGAWGGCE